MQNEATKSRRVIEIFQQDIQGGGFVTTSYKLPDGVEVTNSYKNRNISYEQLKPYVGEKATLHVYKEQEYIYSEKVILEGFIDSPFGGEVPLFFFEEEV